MKKTLIIITIITGIIAYAITSEISNHKQAFVNKIGHYITNEEAMAQLEQEREAYEAAYQIAFYRTLIDELNNK